MKFEVKNMGYPSLEEIAQETKDWDFIKNLPDHIGPFTKSVSGTITGKILQICTYSSAALRAKVDLIFTSETFDYILVRTIGINVYRDINYIYKEKDIFATKVGAKLPEILHTIEHPEEVNLGEMVANKKILTWQYGNNLPEQLDSFQLYIKPSHSIEYLNGSIILIDYTDFAKNDQFVVYYNRLRNQFFGELKIAGVFHATKDFDSTNLTQLQAKLEKHLKITLQEISSASHEI